MVAAACALVMAGLDELEACLCFFLGGSCASEDSLNESYLDRENLIGESTAGGVSYPDGDRAGSSGELSRAVGGE